MNGSAAGAGPRTPGRGIVGKRKREGRPSSPHVSAGVSPPATWPLPDPRARPPPPLQPAGTWAVAAVRAWPRRRGESRLAIAEVRAQAAAFKDRVQGLRGWLPPSMANEEDDPVVQEYPVRPASMTYDDSPHLSAKIKPKQQKVELEMAIDTLNPNYCRSKGEQIALNVDGACADETSTYSSKLMDKQTFCSSQTTSNTSRYAAALYRQGELHLTPLHGILQLRPSFSYLDKADAKHREREAANEAGDSSQDEAEEDVKQITVRFSRPESEQARQRRVQSYEFLQKKQAEEPWVHLHYHGLRDSRSEHERQYLLCQGSSGVENTELVKSPSEYLMMLMPPSQEEEKDKPVAPSNVLSMAQLRTLPLADQIKILMKNVKVMPFANLMSLLGPSVDSVAVLRGIQKVAMLVQGNWVVKSDILYPKDSSSPHSGVPAEVLCRGRDFVMWKFTQSRWVVRKEVAAVTKLCAEDVKDFLEHMAVVRINKGWEFILPYDGEFIKKHPDVVQRQHMLWTGIQAKLEKVYNLVKETMPKKSDGQSGPAGLVSGDQRVQVAKTKAQQNHAFLERELQRRKEQMRVSTVLPAVQIKEEPLSEEGEDDEQEAEDEEEPMDTSPSGGLNSRLANGLPAGRAAGGDSFNGHPLPGCASTPVARELRAFVESTFQRQFVLTLSELKRLFNLHLASLPPGHTLFSGISDRMLQDTVLAAGCKQILVPHRQVLLEIFSKNYRVRRNMIQSRLTQECGEDLSKQEVDKVLKIILIFWNVLNDLTGYFHSNFKTERYLCSHLSVLYGTLLYVLAFLLPWFPWKVYEEGDWLSALHLVVSLCAFDSTLTCLQQAQCTFFAETVTRQESRLQLIKVNHVASLVGSTSILFCGLISNNLEILPNFQSVAIVMAFLAAVSLYSGMYYMRYFEPKRSTEENFFLESEQDFTWTSVALFLRQILSQKNFYLFLIMSFLQVFHLTFLNNFMMIFAETLIPGNVLSSSTRSIMYGAGFICPQCLVLMCQSWLKKFGYYKIILTSFYLEGAVSIVMLLLGQYYYYCLAFYLIIIK
ncbi:DNA-directed RNA polymerase III subunit RPC5 [Sciurus carolinensis]|uniref:DNA-directed RNA polymerase III subunit RPC5 n=1 Tax=Sciurus carolinensis TaxID=30640 RepID=A0AA41SSZ1_SCICA|nr:DNA-directed RNA polymerase III subunit RPC5 [Sciurus carolinensis]